MTLWRWKGDPVWRCMGRSASTRVEFPTLYCSIIRLLSLWAMGMKRQSNHAIEVTLSCFSIKIVFTATLLLRRFSSIRIIRIRRAILRVYEYHSAWRCQLLCDAVSVLTQPSNKSEGFFGTTLLAGCYANCFWLLGVAVVFTAAGLPCYVSSQKSQRMTVPPRLCLLAYIWCSWWGIMLDVTIDKSAKRAACFVFTSVIIVAAGS